MKKNFKIYIIVFILTGFGRLASAQTEKGTFILGASSKLEFSSQTVKSKRENTDRGTYKSNTFEVTPGAGYFVVNNLAIGVQLSIDRMVAKEDEDKFSETTSMILPFALLYFGKGAVKPFVQAAYGPGWIKSGNRTDKLTGYELGGGLAIFLNLNVSFDISLGYGSVTHTTDEIGYHLVGDDNHVEWKTTAKGLGGNLGFSVYF